MRTKNSVLNFLSTYTFYFVVAILGFIKARVFLSGLGENLYSLNQVYNNIFSYLTLLEAGMGAALIYRLYSLLSAKKYDAINKLYSGTVVIFRKIGFSMIIVSCFVSFLIPFFIKNNPFQLWFLIITFMLFIFKGIVDYFFFIPRYIVIAENKAYKINVLIYCFRIIEVGIEVILLYFKFNYIVVLIPTIILSFLLNYLVNKKIKKLYPWLKFTKDKNFEIKNDVNNMLVHRVAGLVFNNIDIILLSTFIGSTAVVIYGAYNYIIKYVTDTTIHIYEAIKDGVGNIIANGQKERIKDVIEETKTIFSYIATIFIITLFFTLNYFVQIWIGTNYSVSTFTLILFLMLLYHKIINRGPLILLNTLGLFKETKRYVIAATLTNLTLSLTLVFKFGINGVLFATVASSYLIEFWCYSFVAAKKLFNEFKPQFWFNHVIKSSSLIIIEVIMLNWLMTWVTFNPHNLIEWLLFAGIIFIVVFATTSICYYFLFKNFRLIILKMRSILIKKKQI